MRRLIAGLAFVLVLLPTATLAAEIGVTVSAPADSGSEGDTCAIHAPRSLSQHPLRWFDGANVESLTRQIIIENERHEIIAVMPLDSGEVTGDDPICTVDGTIDLPDATFYTIRLDGEYITTVAVADVSADRQLVVTLDD